MTQNEYLHEIYNNLNDGMIYGRPVTGVRYPFFDENLYVSDHDCICFSHYGESAVRNTLRDLYWLIANIFDMTPEEFCKGYQCKSVYEINADYDYE